MISPEACPSSFVAREKNAGAGYAPHPTERQANIKESHSPAGEASAVLIALRKSR